MAEKTKNDKKLKSCARHSDLPRLSYGTGNPHETKAEGQRPT